MHVMWRTKYSRGLKQTILIETGTASGGFIIKDKFWDLIGQHSILTFEEDERLDQVFLQVLCVCCQRQSRPPCDVCSGKQRKFN